MSEHKYTNALIHETSPYLIQHAHNPVDWHPWSEGAFRKAREEDKPILLSIGYSACHWCHVMERESFENEEIAALMNELFVNIKVDREERPDLDAVYMRAVQMITGGGGWPMTVFLTADRVPFYGGTYFPPTDSRGMPGFPRVLRSVAQAYHERKSEIERDAASIVHELRKADEAPRGEETWNPDTLAGAAARLLSDYDSRNGGFGSAPKFPQTMALEFLLRAHVRTGTPRMLEAVEETLQRMAAGGICDQLGGGFHRYSVDAQWLVPHFEKMLYDNALLGRLYLAVFLITGNPQYRRVAEETLDWVMGEMTDPEGGFYSTQDADSEGEEGKFYTWELREVEHLLGRDHAELFCRYYGIVEDGALEGRNVLHIPRSAQLVARLNNVSEEELRREIERGKRILLAARKTRIPPVRDEKILASWNGLMLRSFAEAAQSLGREDYRAAAERCATFLLSHLRRGDRLLHSYISRRANVGAFVEDYACVANGLLSLYEATFDSHWVEEAGALAETLLDQFLDTEGVGFFLTSREHETLIHRPKDFYDNATPSGNSEAAHLLMRLAGLTGDARWSRPVEPILKNLGSAALRHPLAFGNLLCALDFTLPGTLEIAVAGDPGADATKSLLHEIFSRYLPNKVVACGSGGRLPLLKDRPMLAGLPAAYVCRNNVCQAPVTGAAELAKLLSS